MTPLVLLPGMMCDGRLFAPQIAALGRGRALQLAPVSNHDTMAALAEDALAHAPPRFALAGLSMGGIVAMEVMARAPERVERLALLDTNPRAELPDVQARRGPQMEKVKAGRLREVMRDEMKPNYLIDGPAKEAVMDLCMEMALDLGPGVFHRQSIALRDRPDRQGVLRQVRVPTLVLCGREDRLCPVERHELIHELIPGSRLEIIDGAAHMPTLEQPDKTTAALARWLED
ncbi:Pimeloyl-[acyl-carrier protein] methyl ester esterase [Defluviimonas aquaemixtae]|uniref:Pimeloyl-[acyl-carrier protein] methyl ester esterase n=1 Tax=Albidovulum aquaemixtae TaxID=1542388 RepID=A0A2R8B6K3_9RHOB|nr:alpha/beta fold hydrolase [Defluviimonas aquaemixtae]SPH18204.1 Pimeloyl-[acyl-carrier protein] methyl ester esterase [Defluviimonas aquaemixtae]